jgi:hypothetical protein
MAPASERLIDLDAIADESACRATAYSPAHSGDHTANWAKALGDRDVIATSQLWGRGAADAAAW